MKLFSTVTEAPLPSGTLLQEFADSGHYTDCFVARVNTEISFPDYVEAFYTTRLFRLERWILNWLVSRPSTDDEARRLSRNELQEFAAWREYSRSDNQLVMMDFRQQTCSWFMLVESKDGRLLYFGSAVMRNRTTESGNTLPPVYRFLMRFHRVYSRALLHAATKRCR